MISCIRKPDSQNAFFSEVAMIPLRSIMLLGAILATPGTATAQQQPRHQLLPPTRDTETFIPNVGTATTHRNWDGSYDTFVPGVGTVHSDPGSPVIVPVPRSADGDDE
jgi:hypothetical protein